MAEALIAHARSLLAHYKAPRDVEFAEALPKSDRGKVLKAQLRG
jgi:fatty-acyl-CoA synthase